jgi:hypothetical protein
MGGIVRWIRVAAAFVGLVSVAGAGVLSAGTAPAAAAPITIRQPFHEIDPLSGPVSAACGFPVIGTIDANEFDVGVVNRSGNVTHEIDELTGGTETVFSPLSGKSFSFPVAMTFHFRYPAGNDVGDPAIVTVDGFERNLPGVHAEAGRQVFANAVIVAIDTSGLPRVAFGDATATMGNPLSPLQAITAVCSALAP